MQRRDVLKAGVALTASAVPGAPALLAQERYPSRSIRLVVGFPPGGPTDVFARRYAEKASPVFGRPVVIDNRPGAGGTVGAAQVAKSPADGYTLLFGSSSTQVTGPLLSPTPPYDPVKDFTQLIVGIVPMVVVVNPALPVKNIQELVALLKANPGKYSYSSSGPGSINHLGGELFKLKAGGLDALHVPYKGNNPALQAGISGEVSFLLDTFGTTLPFHKAGRLRIIAVCADKRSKVLPDIPTVAEAGIEGVLVPTVNVVAMPSATPAPVVSTIVDVTRRVMRDESLAADLAGLSIETVTDADPARSQRFIADEIARWAPIVKATGATL